MLDKPEEIQKPYLPEFPTHWTITAACVAPLFQGGRPTVNDLCVHEERGALVLLSASGDSTCAAWNLTAIVSTRPSDPEPINYYYQNIGPCYRIVPSKLGPAVVAADGAVRLPAMPNIECRAVNAPLALSAHSDFTVVGADGTIRVLALSYNGLEIASTVRAPPPGSIVPLAPEFKQPRSVVGAAITGGLVVCAQTNYIYLINPRAKDHTRCVLRAWQVPSARVTEGYDCVPLDATSLGDRVVVAVATGEGYCVLAGAGAQPDVVCSVKTQRVTIIKLQRCNDVLYLAVGTESPNRAGSCQVLTLLI